MLNPRPRPELPRPRLRTALASALVASALLADAASAAEVTVTVSKPEDTPHCKNAQGQPIPPSGPTDRQVWQRDGSPGPKCPTSNDPRVVDLTIQTDSLGRDPTYARIFLPKEYLSKPTMKWPVLFLLIGHGSGYQAWSCDSFARQYLENENVLVVMPDGSRSYNPCLPADKVGDSAIPSFHSNWHVPSKDGNPEQWENYHIGELQKILKDNYRASGVYGIAGASMAGGGALQYAARHRGMFKFAASFSGALHWISATGLAAQNGTLIAAGQDTNAPWNFYPGTPGALLFGTDWPLHDPTYQVDPACRPEPPALIDPPGGAARCTLREQPMYIAYGDGSDEGWAPRPGESKPEDTKPEDIAAEIAVELGARSMNEDFLATLKKNSSNGKLPSTTTARWYKGTHAWQYWDAAFCDSLGTLLPLLSPPPLTLAPGQQPPARVCRQLTYLPPP